MAESPPVLLNIEDPATRPKPGWAPFALGFRPFFLGAGVAAAALMAVWMGVNRGYVPDGVLVFGSPVWWHAHAMIYGFAVAAIAGFLLTAVKNWTGLQTPHGGSLAALFTTWAAARILPFLGAPLWAAASADLVFCAVLTVAVTVPLVRKKRWRDVGIFTSKLTALTVGNALVYFGGPARPAGLYLGLFLVIAVVLTIGKRVFPMFIELGIGGGIKLDRAPRLALANLGLFAAFLVVFLGWPQSPVTAALALGVAAVNGWRLWLWSPRGVWRRALLWPLVLGYFSVVVGFLGLAASYLLPELRMLAVHALTTGGIGLIVLAMMARVTLGHTGRNVRRPANEGLLHVVFGALWVAVVVRVAGPLLGLMDYGVVLDISQGLWVLAFAAFVVLFGPKLMRTRVDGKPG